MIPKYAPAYANRSSSGMTTTTKIALGVIILVISLMSLIYYMSKPTNASSAMNININYSENNNNIPNNIYSMPFNERLKYVKGTYDDIHIVVTTGCNGYQNWQSEVLLYSWASIKQPGRITRIVAGCKNDKEIELANRTGIPNNENRILTYFVDDYTPDEPGKGHPFHYFNKPFGMNKWLHDKKDEIYESVIVLIDPDMIITKKFLFHIKEEADKYSEFQGTWNEKRDLWVREGHPVSQKYGIGPKWTHWKGFCDDIPSCNVNEKIGWNYYSVGPPYMMHKNDWLKIAPKWVEYSPHALELEPQPSILAEMYSYVIACAHFDLKHEYLYSMISDPNAGRSMESWGLIKYNFINQANREAEDAADIIDFHIIHYCQGFWLGQTRNKGTIRNGGVNFHKGHMPQEILYNCEIPLLAEIRDDGDNKDMKIFKDRDRSKSRSPNDGQYRHAWILYHLYKFTNKAIINYRNKYCQPGWNHEFKLVLQQPEADVHGRRMNYVLGDYKSGKSWFGH